MSATNIEITTAVTTASISLLALVVLELKKQAENKKQRIQDQNGENPVVRALGTINETMKREHDLTRTKLAECYSGTDKRMEEHERREENKWDETNRSLVELVARRPDGRP